jgi:hypothetical protein
MFPGGNNSTNKSTNAADIQPVSMPSCCNKHTVWKSLRRIFGHFHLLTWPTCGLQLGLFNLRNNSLLAGLEKAKLLVQLQ